MSDELRCSKCGEWVVIGELVDDQTEWYCTRCGHSQQLNDIVEDISTELALVNRITDDEVLYSLKRYGHIKSVHEGYAILIEEVEEYWDSIKLNNPDPKELVQVCAMAKLALIDLNRIIAKSAEWNIYRQVKKASAKKISQSNTE
ncbi:MAG: hypothetical protein GY861_22500 [bacterium]|nr:hypothetical protein [bacterium]